MSSATVNTVADLTHVGNGGTCLDIFTAISPFSVSRLCGNARSIIGEENLRDSMLESVGVEYSILLDRDMHVLSLNIGMDESGVFLLRRR